MKHGEERNRRVETTSHGTYQTNVGEIPRSSVTHTVTEKWCSHCNQWTTCKGILDAIVSPCCNNEWI